ncbi:LOW QUALITY PROTEIN: wall-associated receptor kinase-like 8 [Primulina eburnea]|uniref:LOW QUALITY PROTEIN: wall-associated receptor kinase-like 8 n=1 Tax=Primulina eburnea TaxID=1245227 RepID=UPI003C6C55C5
MAKKKMGFPFLLISLLRWGIVSQSVSLSKPGCPEKCGNITIPYPFGIGSKCSESSSFTVVCQNSSIPFLSRINLEIVNISLKGMVKVKQHISPMACTVEQRTMSLINSLLGSPFIISESYNKLIVLGCRNAGWLRANKTSTTIGGCMAICDANTTGLNSCNGVNCCQISITLGLQEPDFTYLSVEPLGKNINSCGYAFLAEEAWFQRDYKTFKGFQHDLLNPFDEEFRFATLALEWIPENPIISVNARCVDRDREYHDHFGYYKKYTDVGRFRLCSCVDGFEGNPYLLEGCRDVDECSDTMLHFCNGTCVNTPGSHRCDLVHQNDHGYQEVKFAMIIIGNLLNALLLIIAVCTFFNVAIKKIRANRRLKNFRRNGGLLLEQHELFASEKGVEKIKLFSSKDLAQATDQYNENRVLGRGGQGTVYKGMLADGKIVAVKKSKSINEGDFETFINEVVILSQINHRNIVKLLGCCLETKVPLLVYEFIPNGTLFQHIHDPTDEFPLTWEMRLRIATDVANSLSYLHSATSVSIYHRDIKSQNILLDEKYRAKVSDFGTSKSVAIDQTHLTTRVLGTFGYLDPEYFRSSHFTEKSDVYSFGVVMVELLTGEKAVSTVRAEEGKSLAIHFLQSMEEDNLFDILDPLVLKEGPKVEIVAIAKLARRCLHMNGKKRPTMKEVAVELEGIKISKAFRHEDHEEDEALHSIDACSSFNSTTSSAHIHPIFMEQP